MPEGDTIHRMAARLDGALRGKALTRFELRRDPRGMRPPPPGTTITSVEARGKHLLVHFDNDTVLHTHMQMTGVWHVYEAGERWRRPGHRARVVLDVAGGTSAVCFDAPLVELRAESPPAAAPSRAVRSLERLGPDLCEPQPDLDTVLRNLAGLDPSTPVADALLDQRVASGIGNVFKSEVCWACRVNPWARVGDLDEERRRALFETAHAQLRANLTTATRTTVAGGLAVYGRRGRPCVRCRTPIRSRKETLDARVTYWCATCQA